MVLHWAKIMRSEVKTYCIIGDPVKHSLSPSMQNAAFNFLGLNCSYLSFRVPRGELKESIESLRAVGFAGFNVTIPHKVDILNYLDELDPVAKLAGAINTVNNIHGRFKGYNTDVAGFIEPLHTRNVNFNGIKILLLGAGGSARAVIVALQNKQISKIIIATRGHEKARELVKIGSSMGLSCEAASIDSAQDLAISSDMIVNTTPLGMNDEQSIIDHEHIAKGTVVYDIVYRPILTNLLENAKYAGANIVYGYEMLLQQGAKSFEIWTGMRAPLEAMRKALFGLFGEPG
jgi:shikimate dehydrogenase